MSNDNPFAAPSSQGYGAQNVGFDAVPQSASAPSASGEAIKDVTTASFQADVLVESRNQPVLVDFWAPWCGPCKQLTPIIESAVRATGGKVKLAKMNIDEHPSIAGQMGVQSIPAVIAFANGQPIDAFMGAKPENEVTAFIEKVIAAGGGNAVEQEKAAIEDALAQAKAAVQAGDLNGAAQIFSMILQRDPENADALGGMVSVMLDAGQKDQAVAMLDQAPELIKDAAPLASVRARIELEEKVAGLGDPNALTRRIEADGNDHDARFDLAQIHAATGDRAKAADQLLAIMKADREWREDGARKELLTFFEAWGPTDPATIAARRKLSSILFS
ncbi:MAG: thioredoxin [Pseudomonadota bacterium]